MIKLSHREINKKLRQLFVEKNIQYCEIGLKKCTGSLGLTYAHRHKRNWYLGKQELLIDFNEVALACLNCHIEIEQDKNLTEEIFKKLRDKDL
jgi:hypothetical protein